MDMDAATLWSRIHPLLSPWNVPWDVQIRLYRDCYASWDESIHGPKYAWFPPTTSSGSSSSPSSSLAHAMLVTNASTNPSDAAHLLFRSNDDVQSTLEKVHRFSVTHPQQFWTQAIQTIPGTTTQRRNVQTHDAKSSSSSSAQPTLNYTSTLANTEQPSHSETWLPGWTLNAAAACASRLSKNTNDDIAALVGRLDDQSTSASLRTARITPDQLRALSVAVARGVASSLFHQNGVLMRRGDACGLCAPMNALSLAAFLGLGLTGVIVVCIADSFSSAEIKQRLDASNASACITQDALPPRKPKAEPTPLYPRVRDAVDETSTPIIVAPYRWPADIMSAQLDDFVLAMGSAMPELCTPLTRHIDVTMRSCILEGLAIESAERQMYNVKPAWCGDMTLTPVPTTASETSLILFSSGTTGKPKPIPWSQVTAVKCAYDAAYHMGVRPGDRVCWPTSFGWMMGPWLVYSSLLNDAAFLAFDGPPQSAAFAQFVSESHATLLGCVPSLVAAWRAGRALEMPGGGWVDWSSLRCFASTGEASRAEDSLWLMSRVAGYRPIVEYCGGTELGGGYMCGNIYTPVAPSCFNGPNIGCDVVLLLGDGNIISYDDARTRSDTPTVGEIAIRPPTFGASRYLLIGSGRSHFDSYYAGMPTFPRGPVEGAVFSDMPGEQQLRRHGDRVEVLPGGYLRARGRTDDAMNLGGIKTSSLEVEAAVMQWLVKGGLTTTLPVKVNEVTAVSVPPPDGGPETLWICFAIEFEDGGGGDRPGDRPWNLADKALVAAAAQAVKTSLNPLFRVAGGVTCFRSLPRTASNKVVRTEVRKWCKDAASDVSGHRSGGATNPSRSKL